MRSDVLFQKIYSHSAQKGATVHVNVFARNDILLSCLSVNLPALTNKGVGFVVRRGSWAGKGGGEW